MTDHAAQPLTPDEAEFVGLLAQVEPEDFAAVIGDLLDIIEMYAGGRSAH